MKITALETLQVAEFPFLCWLRVHTDAGIIGTGETFWAPGPVASYIHDNVAPYLIGKDPIAASERLASRQMFKQLMDKRAASVIMIDLAWFGGLSEARKIANMAEASELPVTLHDCTGPIVYAASCALSATLPNAIYQEAVRAYFTGWYTEIVADLPQVTDGRVKPLDGAGLRMRLREELFTRPDATVRRTGV